MSHRSRMTGRVHRSSLLIHVLSLIVVLSPAVPGVLTANDGSVASIPPINISVLSWNLHGLPWPLSRDPKERIDKVAEKIRGIAPDVIALQEVWLSAQVDRLARELAPEWSPIYVRRRLGGPSGGLVAFVRRPGRCAIQGDARFDAFVRSAPAWKMWEGDGLGRKGILNFKLRCDQYDISIVDTHLQSQYPGNDYSAIRQEQFRQLKSFESSLDNGSFVLIAADFNTDAHEPLYSRVIALGVDLTADARRHCSCGTVVEVAGASAEWIDYILARVPAGWSTSATITLIPNRGRDDPYSDHQGVFGLVSFNRVAGLQE